jgi:predicted MFS family arabinose efflux permease
LTGSSRLTGSPRLTGLAATLSTGMVVSTFVGYAFGALGPFIIDDLGLSRTALGSLTTVMYFVGSALSPVLGPLVDRFGGRRSLLALFAVGSAGTLVVAASPGYGGLVAGAALAGVAVALGNIATNQLIARHVEPTRQGILTGVKQSGVQVGAFLAGAALPALAEAWGWRWALAASALIAAGGVAGTLLTVPSHTCVPQPSGRRLMNASTGPLGTAVNRLTAYSTLMGLGVGAAGAYLPLYAVEELGTSRRAAGLAAGIMGLVGVLARVWWGRLHDRTTTPVTRTLLLLAAGSVVAAGLVWAARASGVALLWAGAVALGATAVAWNALGMLSIVRDVDASRAGRASGRVLLGFFAGFFVGPVSFGAVVDATGTYAFGWAGVTAAFLAATMVAWRWRSAAPEGVTGEA